MDLVKCGDPNNPAGPGHRGNGDPCKLDVVPGMTRCHLHGGSSPQAKIKAEQAMALLRMPAVETLYRVLDTFNKVIEQFQDDTCAACGFPKGDAEEKVALVKACRSAAMTCSAVLDRTGIGPRSTVEVKQSDGDLDLALLTNDEKQDLIQALAQVKAVKARIKARLHEVAFGVMQPPAQSTSVM